MDRLASGQRLQATSLELKEVIASLKFIPVAERVIEAKHKDVKRALQRLTNHRAPRVSLAVRQSELTKLTNDTSTAKALEHALQQAREITSLPAKLGFASHPDLLTCRGAHETRKALTKVVYRCDLPAQYFDLAHATRIDSAVKEKEKQAAKKQHETNTSKPKVTWQNVLARALATYMQCGGSPNGLDGGSQRRHTFSLDMRHAPDAKWVRLSKAIEGEGPCERRVVEQTSPVFFTPLARKNFAKLHRVPHPAAVGEQLLTPDTVLCMVSVAVATDCSQPIAALDPHSCSGPGNNPSTVLNSKHNKEDRAGSVWALSNLQAIQLRTESQVLLEWERVPGEMFYALGDKYLSNPPKQGQLSQLLERMFLHGAVSHATDKDGHLSLCDAQNADYCNICTSEADADLLSELTAQGYVAPGQQHGFDFDFVLTPAGTSQVHCGQFLRNPMPVLRTQLVTDTSKVSLLHGLLALLDQGWTWQQRPVRLQRQADPFSPQTPKLFFSAGAEVDLQYVRALLDADRLFASGCPCIPHGLPTDDYTAILEGTARESIFSTHASANQKSKKTSGKVPLEQDADALCLDRLGPSSGQAIAQAVAAMTAHLPAPAPPLAAPRAEPGMEPKDSYMSVRVARTGPLASGRQQQTSKLTPALTNAERPVYFERQVAALCGLHALNNACGSRTGRQTFTQEDAADGLHTLKKEYARDGLPWDIGEHASPRGDYSLKLLTWMLQRRRVCKPLEIQFAATNLLDRCTETQLLAEDLVGGLVHMPSEEDPSNGHWVSFAVHQQSGYWWMDSQRGFQRVALAQLCHRLSNHRFVLSLFYVVVDCIVIVIVMKMTHT